MADTKSVGPEGPVQPTGSREKRLPSDAEAFQKKLEKAGEADPEQKKKRRQQEEEVEEISDKMKEAKKAARTKDMIAPFEIGKKLAAKPSLDKGAPTAETVSAQITPPMAEEIDAETQFWEEDEFELPPTEAISEEKGAPPTAHKPFASKEAPPLEKEGKKGEVEVAPISIEEAKKKRGEKEEKEAALKPPSEEVITAPPPPLPEITPPSPPTETTPYAQLSPAVLALFERIAGVMTVMTQSGVTETTVSLTSDQFKSSPFYRAEIVIREYSSAPKQFNIEVRGNAEAVAQFQANIPYLESTFRTGKYNFGIHRLETSIQKIEEEPVSRDKEDKEER